MPRSIRRQFAVATLLVGLLFGVSNVALSLHIASHHVHEAHHATETTAAIDHSQSNVTGTVRLKLYKGTAAVVGRKAPGSLYSEAHVTFEDDDVYDQHDAEGFIKLNALRLKLLKQRRR